MRHRTDSVNGIMEFLIARMAERLRDERQRGIHELIGGAAGRYGIQRKRTRGKRSVASCTANGRRHHGTSIRIHSLFRFKLKFHPDEEKCISAIPTQPKLPQISLAVAQAYVPSLTPAEAMRFVRTIAPRD
mgnify:CR=1 FL=1